MSVAPFLLFTGFWERMDPSQEGMKIYNRGLFLCAKGHHHCVLLGAFLIRYICLTPSLLSVFLSFIEGLQNSHATLHTPPKIEFSV